jgi:hypothetical protein
MFVLKSAYFLATTLWLVGCINPTSVPQQKIQETSAKEIKPDFLDGFETVIWYDNDPYPSVCSLSGVMGNVIGSGILIAPNVVLTAGHCIDDVELSYVSFGDQMICISETLIHPDYNLKMRVPHDIGLLFLEHEVYGIEPATLHDEQFICRFAPITTVGFSFSYKKYSKPGTFRYFGIVMENIGEIKFLPNETSIWYGDSGGAVFTQHRGKRILIGIITSFMIIDERIIECSATRVNMFRHWIEESINKHEGVLENAIDATNNT